MAIFSGVKKAQITLNPEHQNSAAINRLVEGILGRAGCQGCGRMVRLDVEFLGDPTPEFQDAGAISVHTEGF